MLSCLGVLRESQHSPNRQSDDALILQAVLAELDALSVRVKLVTPEEFDAEELSRWDLVLPMCETYGRLKRLAAAGAKTMIINRATGVLDCYRIHMVPLLAQIPQVVFPPSEIRMVSQGAGDPPAVFSAPDGWWLKRGDVHNTCDHDVVRVDNWAHAAAVFRDFRSREITHAIVQPHIPGDLIKFYGVGPSRWSTWFYHNPDQAKGLPFDTEELAAAAAAAAAALGLEIFGGDAIVGEGKRITIIDVNSWPSFAKVRGGAAPHIARHLHGRLRSQAASPREQARAAGRTS